MAVLGIVGWARPARLIRGVVRSVRWREHVVAARASGATDAYLLRRHILPQLSGLVLTQLALLIPQYILAEITLSFSFCSINSKSVVTSSAEKGRAFSI